MPVKTQPEGPGGQGREKDGAGCPHMGTSSAQEVLVSLSHAQSFYYQPQSQKPAMALHALLHRVLTPFWASTGLQHLAPSILSRLGHTASHNMPLKTSNPSFPLWDCNFFLFQIPSFIPKSTWFAPFIFHWPRLYSQIASFFKSGTVLILPVISKVCIMFLLNIVYTHIDAFMHLKKPQTNKTKL